MEITVILILLGSYLLGAIPFGLLFGKWIKGKDPRSAGSGNIGFTNVLRVVGVAPAVLTLIGDVGKGALAAYLGKSAGGMQIGQLAALLAVLGHCYPVYLKFRGGKAVATSFGVLSVLYIVPGLLTFGVWVLTVLWSRYISLGALVGFATLPLWMAWLQLRWDSILFSLTIAVLIFVRHRDNIQRLYLKKEGRIT